MRLTRTCLLALAVALIAACGEAPKAPPTESPPPAAQTTEPAAPATQEQPSAAEEPPPAIVEESAATDAEPAAEQVILGGQADEPAPSAAREWQFKEGEDFRALPAAQGTSSAPGTVEVAEIFWYGCPHCFTLDPMLEQWKQTLPEGVSFVRVPVMWNPTNEIHARLYYTAEALNKLDEMHSAIFREIHLNNSPLTSEDQIQQLFAKFGISAEDFGRTFRSFAVESKLQRARNLTQRYRVKSVPLLVVDGKYTTDAPAVKSYEDMLAVTSELVDRERANL